MNSVHPNLCFAGTIFLMQAYSSLGLRGFEPIETMSACFNWLQNVLKGRASLPCLMQCWANSNLCLEILLTLFHNHSVIYTGVYLSIFERNLYTKDVHCIIVNTLYSLSHFEMRRCKSRFWGLSKKHPKVEHGSCPEHELWPFSKEPCLVRTWIWEVPGSHRRAFLWEAMRRSRWFLRRWGFLSQSFETMRQCWDAMRQCKPPQTCHFKKMSEMSGMILENVTTDYESWNTYKRQCIVVCTKAMHMFRTAHHYLRQSKLFPL